MELLLLFKSLVAVCTLLEVGLQFDLLNFGQFLIKEKYDPLLILSTVLECHKSQSPSSASAPTSLFALYRYLASYRAQMRPQFLGCPEEIILGGLFGAAHNFANHFEPKALIVP